MPVYLCKPGWSASEPWRHGVQVYAYPYPLVPTARSANTSNVNQTSTNSSDNESRNNTSIPRLGPTVVAEAISTESNEEQLERIPPSPARDESYQSHPFVPNSGHILPKGVPIRRVRHAELVLVDEVSIHYGTYWLRLRWPGPRGGVAGYIALGGEIPAACIPTSDQRAGRSTGRPVPFNYNNNMARRINSITNPVHYFGASDAGRIGVLSDVPGPDNTVNSAQSNIGLLSNVAHNEAIKCDSTGIYYPTSPAMELLPTYNDGLSGRAGSDEIDENGREPIFCRICREGIHDIDYDFQAEGSNGINRGVNTNTTTTEQNRQLNLTAFQNTANISATRSTSENSMNGALPGGNVPELMSNTQSQGIQVSHPYADNPLLAPCECAGSMAFVHYMCIEQWRCRSNHPAAKNGLNCETCKEPYTLPPPPSRPESTREEDDWMEAMPPHVLAALRRPHFWWQIGAMIVRRRWLRPVAPIVFSPIVALYCRARRTLKKRGVSRRRWACSLCGRRARWKCVRCLRSYYCSRHCQNVSWHIVHKHVCYKPVRFWWSVLVYGLAVIWFVPGVLQYPMVYDLGVTLLGLSFLVVGILGGGTATLMKKGFGVDIRGRLLELVVVAMTLLLAGVSWSLAWQFFGHKNHCWGVVDLLKRFPYRLFNSPSVEKDIDLPRQVFSVPSLFKYHTFWKNEAKTHDDFDLTLRLVRSFLLVPTKAAMDLFDTGLLRSGPWVTRRICSMETSCLEMTQMIDPDFMFAEDGGETCASDMRLVIRIYFLSALTLILGTILKRRGRHAIGGRIARGVQQRPHQD